MNIRRFSDVLKVLTWAWVIVVGGLLITPDGVWCIVCGMPIDAIGFIGYGGVRFLGIGSILLGVVGLITTIITARRPTIGRGIGSTT